MKYSNSEAMSEVLARRDQVRRKRERRRTVWYGVSVCAILAALILAFVLGTLAALIIIRRKQGFQKPDPKNESPEASKNNENGGSST